MKLKPNQFNPTPEEIEAIKESNKLLPESERICYKCGHKTCPHCLDWCDCMLSDIELQGNWEYLEEENVDTNGKVNPPHACCDMECSY